MVDKQVLAVEQELASRFESLGFNCEFGFVQTRCGWQQGGLLRWAVAMPGPLLKNLRNGFDGIYEWDSLVVRNPKMVTDTASGLGFHTGMHSKDGAFVHGEEERRRIHEEERAKFLFLRDRLLEQLAEGHRMFVYKYNPGVEPEIVQKIARTIGRAGPGRFLYVQAAERPEQVGTVTHEGGNLYLGYVEKLWWRDPEPANVDYAGWRKLMQATERFLP
ncbi:hypothetical protein [Mangrovicoccus sp. HB161399]|uniref:hypothetical protein n=1 Tax=Mangrovicoccus sp. HB161399 TaxID=2720392 RepID=UPI0015580262|nr:hypothetical protein [Mangrovicoccus sp. HB161399]